MTTGSNRILSIDVECVATSISLIKPTEKVISDLYSFTGLRIKDLEQASSLEDVLQKIYPFFDSTTIIVGQNPKSDVKWLKLKKGIHYSSMIDLSDWFKIYNPRFGSMNYFSLAHEAWTLINIDLNARNGHLATQDAKAAMQLYLKYKDNEKDKEQARRLLLNNRPRMTPAKACNYNYESVCLAGFFKQMCTCNRPSLSDD